ncbi:hypothetical protein EV581_1066 [Bacillus sp. BK006]|nr:hypothetical protein EV581_1066 [Bacillus sp. BK006]
MGIVKVTSDEYKEQKGNLFFVILFHVQLLLEGCFTAMTQPSFQELLG